jgi:lipopolysaccharide transport system permease protein
MFHNLWAYRQFVLSSIRNELVSRFARSKLGGLWMIINPLSQVAIYALILSNVLAAKLPGIEENEYGYAIYLMAGLLAWTLFSEIVGRCLTLFIEQGNLMKKMQFPRITLPAIVVGSSILNNALLFIAMLGVFLLLGHKFSWVMIWLLPLTLVLASFALGMGLVLGIVNVFVRDLGQVVLIILQMWFWFTPIVYPEDIIPEGYRDWLNFNPVYHFTSAYQDILVYGRIPEAGGLIAVGTSTLLLLLLGLFFFRRSSEEMVDVL